VSEPVLRLDGLEKRFGTVRALRGVTLDVPPGPVGLLGPNGAGKSTLLKLLLGLIAPSGGTARIAGHDPSTAAGRRAIRACVGYMPEADSALPGTNAVEMVATLARVSGMTTEDAMTRAHEVLDYVGLGEARYRDAEAYSTGMKQRLKLAQALAHDPEILLLDEPTNGLDPKGRRHMLEVIEDLGKNERKNLLLCSHLLPDVERTCEKVVVLHEGAVLASEDIENMTRREERWMRVEVRTDPERLASELERRGLAFERGAEHGAELGLRVRLPEGNDEDGDELFACARAAGVTLTGLEPVRSTLEEAFFRALDGARSPAEANA